jgi:Deacetylase PdaC
MRSILAAALLSMSLVSSPVAFAQEQEKSEFSYTYPDTLSANPKLVQELEARKVKRSALFEEDVKTVGEAGAANNLESQASWEIKSETDRLIVLVSSNYVYSGGAHGMFWSDAILWDKKRGQEIGFLDLFADKEAATKALMPAYCAMLDAERLGMRGEATAKDALFGDCVDPFENGIVFPTALGSGGYLRIGFVLPPYSAGPYVEGEYSFDISAPDYITKGLKPEYRDLFQSYM